MRWRRGLIAGLLALTVAAATRGRSSPCTTPATLPGSMPSPCPASSPHDSLTIDSAAPVTARQLAVAAWRVSPTDQASPPCKPCWSSSEQDGMLPVTTDLA